MSESVNPAASMEQATESAGSNRRDFLDKIAWGSLGIAAIGGVRVPDRLPVAECAL